MENQTLNCDDGCLMAKTTGNTAGTCTPCSKTDHSNIICHVRQNQRMWTPDEDKKKEEDALIVALIKPTGSEAHDSQTNT